MAQDTDCLQPLAPEGAGWPTERKHILTSSIIRKSNKRHTSCALTPGLLWGAVWTKRRCQKRTSAKSSSRQPASQPAIQQAGWNTIEQIYREYTLRPGRVVVRGNHAARDKKSVLRADYVLFYKTNIPLVVVEAK